jgi:hypothetical protein
LGCGKDVLNAGAHNVDDVLTQLTKDDLFDGKFTTILESAERHKEITWKPDYSHLQTEIFFMAVLDQIVQDGLELYLEDAVDDVRAVGGVLTRLQSFSYLRPLGVAGDCDEDGGAANLHHHGHRFLVQLGIVTR